MLGLDPSIGKEDFQTAGIIGMASGAGPAGYGAARHRADGQALGLRRWLT